MVAGAGFDRGAVLAAAAVLRRDGPVPVVFADAAAAYLIDNWLAHARAAGVARVLLLALDGVVAARPAPPGGAVVPVPFAGDLGDLWLRRLDVFAVLAAAGIDFIHSDLDAVWLADARPACFADPALDLVFSQGTFLPAEAHAAWGFVLCCGLFAVRAGPAAARFLAAVRARAAEERDDQVAVNRLLLEGGVAWAREGAEAYAIGQGGQRFTCHRRMLRGAGAGVRVGLLPFHRVPRLATAGPALVKHPHATREPAARIAALRRSGVWLGDVAG
jgi:hypothetical protein